MPMNLRANLVEMDMLTVLETRAATPACWDALVFFGQNPAAQTFAEVIAQKSGQSTRQAAQDLDDLIALGVLAEFKNDKQKSYALVDDPLVRQAVIHFARRTAFD